jgi:hypothetical protein
MAFNNEFELAVNIYVVQLLFSSNFKVQKTTLPDCNFFGLFSKRNFKQGETINWYVGDRLRTIAAVRIQNKDYLMRLGQQSYVNAGPHAKVSARYTVVSLHNDLQLQVYRLVS